MVENIRELQQQMQELLKDLPAETKLVILEKTAMAIRKENSQRISRVVEQTTLKYRKITS